MTRKKNVRPNIDANFPSGWASSLSAASAALREGGTIFALINCYRPQEPV